MKASQIVQRLNDEAENQIDTFLVNLNATQSTSTFNVINSLHQDIHNGIGHTLSNLVYSPSEPETVADHILPHIILRGGAFLHLTPKLLSDASYWWS